MVNKVKLLIATEACIFVVSVQKIDSAFCYIIHLISSSIESPVSDWEVVSQILRWSHICSI